MDQRTRIKITSKRELKNTPEFRPDLQGVRALAVLLVVLFHAKMPFVTGGYIGVDIFYVLSGYFITGILFRELQNNGKTSLKNFYARRILRILPVSSLVLCATSILAMILLSPLLFKKLAVSTLAANIFLVNLVFAKDSVDYLADNINYSPILHYWSLSVEEQFYIFFPTILIVLTKFSQRIKRSLITPISLIGIGIISFLVSINLTNTLQPLAFFLLPTRAWELLCGSLIAVTAPRVRNLGVCLSSVMQLSGLGLILGATITLDAGSNFPGYIAAIPVLGTSLIILATPQKSAVSGLLSSKYAQAVGRWSFSIYLWHWPLLTISWIYFGSNSVTINTSIVVLSFILAALSYNYWENPIRTNRYWNKTKYRIRYIVVFAFLAPVVCASMLLFRHGSVQNTSSPVSPISQQALTPAIAKGLVEKGLPKSLSPSLNQAADDAPKTYSDGCHVIGSRFSGTEVKPCIFGDPSSRNSMWLIGDSHAAQWFPALEAIATDGHIKFVALTKSACPTVLTAIPNPVSKNESYDACAQYNRAVLQRAKVEKPDVIVVSGSSKIVSQAYNDGLNKYLIALPESSNVFYLEDTPHPDNNIPQCLTTPFKNRSSCNFSMSKIDVKITEAIRNQVIRSKRHYIAIDSWLCLNNQCPAIVENVLIYRDDSHISTAASYWLLDILKDHLNHLY